MLPTILRAAALCLCLIGPAAWASASPAPVEVDAALRSLELGPAAGAARGPGRQAGSRGRARFRRRSSPRRRTAPNIGFSQFDLVGASDPGQPFDAATCHWCCARTIR